MSQMVTICLKVQDLPNMNRIMCVLLFWVVFFKLYMTWQHWRHLFPLLVKWSNFAEITMIIQSRWRTSEGYLRKIMLEMGRSIFHYVLSGLWFHFQAASETRPRWYLTYTAFLCFKAHLNSVFTQKLKIFEQSALCCQWESHTRSLLVCTSVHVSNSSGA